MVDYNGLENRRTERYRGFESLSLRNLPKCKSLILNGLAAFFSLCSPTFRFFRGTSGEHFGEHLGNMMGTFSGAFEPDLVGFLLILDEF